MDPEQRLAPTAPDPMALLGATVRLTSQVEALAALLANARVQTESLDVDPRIGALLSDVSHQLIGSATLPAGAPVQQALGMARALIRESMQLIDDPGRVGGWATTDEAVLQGVGKLSMAIAPVLAAAAGQLHGLAARLDDPGARLLDVGTGTAWLAIAIARTMPTVSVVGIDIFDPSLALARTNVASEGLSDRVSIVKQDVTQLDASDQYDAIWLPLPFLPHDVVVESIPAAAAALKPGGWLLPGTFGGPPDALSKTLVDLRIVRSGGHPWSGDEVMTMMTRAGLSEAQYVPRTWAAPLELWAAQRR